MKINIYGKKEKMGKMEPDQIATESDSTYVSPLAHKVGLKQVLKKAARTKKLKKIKSKYSKAYTGE